MSRAPFSSGSPLEGCSFRPSLDVLEDRFAPGSLLESSPAALIDISALLAAAQRQVADSAADSAADVALMAAQANQQAATHTTSPVLSFADRSVKGSSTLVRTDSGVSMSLTTSGLAPGAYTVWWVVFNHPENCSDGACGMDDLRNPAVAATVGFAAGQVVGPNGTATFAGHLNEGEALTVIPGSLLAARTAEIHLVVRYHGEAVPGEIDQQIHTFEAGDPDTVDVQFSVHKAP